MEEKAKRERFMERLVRVFREAELPPALMLFVPPLMLAELPRITVPEIRAVLYLQQMVVDDPAGLLAVKKLLEYCNQEGGTDG